MQTKKSSQDKHTKAYKIQPFVPKCIQVVLINPSRDV